MEAEKPSLREDLVKKNGSVEFIGSDCFLLNNYAVLRNWCVFCKLLICYFCHENFVKIIIFQAELVEIQETPETERS